MSKANHYLLTLISSATMFSVIFSDSIVCLADTLHPFQSELFIAPQQDNNPLKLFSEGTGTRGGGSGIITNKKVELLDVYRSQVRTVDGLFFEIDSRLTEISQRTSPEQATQIIIEAVLSRIQKFIPRLGERMNVIQKRLPFAKWTASVVALPLQKDFHGQLDLNAQQEHVQIAYRRADQVIYDVRLFQAMDGLNRAALILHEYLYAITGVKDSYSVQQLLSFLMSAVQNESDYEKTCHEVLRRLFLGTLDSPDLDLPEGVRQVEVLNLEANDLCGTVKSMQATKGNLKLTLSVDPARPHLSRADFSVENMNPPRLTMLADLKLKGKELKTFLTSYFFAKDYFQKKFPIYLYPAQAWPADLVCVHRRTGKILSLESAIEFNQRKNQGDLDNAKLEASYYQEYASYLQLRTKLAVEWGGEANIPSMMTSVSEFRLQSTEFRLAAYREIANTANAYQALGILSSAQELGKIILKFDH